MEAKKATIQREETNTYLILHLTDAEQKITLTDDNPNNVKAVFNVLLKELKKGSFKFELEDSTEDLYQHICMEYITQLNAEMITVYKELDEFELLENKED
jgi:hypothetical protein